MFNFHFHESCFNFLKITVNFGNPWGTLPVIGPFIYSFQEILNESEDLSSGSLAPELEIFDRVQALF